MTNAMPNYPFFLTQVTNVVYIPIFFGKFLCKRIRAYFGCISVSVPPKFKANYV